jgi:hypothetical protein
MNNNWVETLSQALPNIDPIVLWTIHCQNSSTYEGEQYLNIVLWKTSTVSPDIDTRWEDIPPSEPIVIHGSVELVGNPMFIDYCQHNDFFIQGSYGLFSIKHSTSTRTHTIHSCLFLSENVVDYDYGIRYTYIHSDVHDQDNISAIKLTVPNFL